MQDQKAWWSSREFRFIRIPKALIDNILYKALSADALLLYGLVLDRSCLSEKNSCYQNKRGVPFVIFTNEEIQAKLRCRHQKASKVLRELETAGLVAVDRKRKVSDANKIYVLPFTEAPPGRQDEG